MILRTLIKFIIGFSIILFIGWNRFLRTRENIELQKIYLPYYNIIFILMLILFFLVIFYINLKKILKFKNQAKFLQNVFVQRINALMKEYITDSPEFVYLALTKNMSFKRFIEGPVSYFTAYYYYPRTIGILLLSIPAAIVATIFVIDVLCFNELKYFFLSLTILIPYLITKILRFVIHHYTEYAIDYLQQFLTFTDAPNNQLAINLKPRDQFPNRADMLTPEQAMQRFSVLCDLWIINRRINNYMTDIEAVRNHYNPYFQFYTSLCYIIGWSAYLYLILQH